jgi:hypothetical protein
MFWVGERLKKGSVADHGFKIQWGQTTDYKITMQHKGVSAKTGWLWITNMCQSGAKCLPVDCCISELAL